MSRMCWMFHDWSVWSKPIEEEWRNNLFKTNFTLFVQERTCLKCGRVERKTVERR